MFFVVVHVPAPCVIVGVSTAPMQCNLCRSTYDWDANSCRCLANADQSHRILCCTSGKKFFDMHPVDLDVFQFCLFSGRSELNFEPLRFCIFEVRNHSFELLQGARRQQNAGWRRSLFFFRQFDAQALLVASLTVFLHC